VRAFDREHALELVKQQADYVMRETFEASLLMARQAVLALGVDHQEADDLIATVRHRDAERFALETSGGLFAGRALVLGNIEHIDPPHHDKTNQADNSTEKDGFLE
jgi:voltage-gated potassium channel Kch